MTMICILNLPYVFSLNTSVSLFSEEVETRSSSFSDETSEFEGLYLN